MRIEQPDSDSCNYVRGELFKQLRGILNSQPSHVLVLVRVRVCVLCDFQYVGKHHLRFSNGDYFVKVGTDSPEDLLAYYEFDGTPQKHMYSPHLRDFNSGDPTWRGGKGKRIIGAFNYLAEVGLNSVSMLLFNVGGDGNNVWPFVSPSKASWTRYDCSKLDQWEVCAWHALSMTQQLQSAALL